MILSICIPTHHGRKSCLQELLNSLLIGIHHSDHEHDIEICISDNASSDGTKEMVAGFVNSHPELIRYRRLEANTGIRNFFSVVEMARGDYCWLAGSDDAILPTGIKQILECIAAFPNAPGITVNKLNFNRDLSALIGPDHDQALPTNCETSRLLSGKTDILENLFTAFFFISAHIFKKKHWKAVVDEIGLDSILKFEHFPHVFVYSEIATREGIWYWLADYCVIQRLENFSFMTEVSSKTLDYAEQHTADLEKIAGTIFLDNKKLYISILNRLFLLYWNPVYALRYASDPIITSSDIRRTRKKCAAWFGHCTYFWLTTYPTLMLPPRICRAIVGSFTSCHQRIKNTPALNPIRKIGKAAYHGLLCLLGIEKKRSHLHTLAKASASAYLLNRPNGHE